MASRWTPGRSARKVICAGSIRFDGIGAGRGYLAIMGYE